MGRTKLALATMGLILAMLGLGTTMALRLDGGSNHAVPVTTAPDSAGAHSATVATRTPPSAEEVQKIIAGLTSQVLSPADTTADTMPLTKEQVEAQLREQLKELGITY